MLRFLAPAPLMPNAAFAIVLHIFFSVAGRTKNVENRKSAPDVAQAPF